MNTGAGAETITHTGARLPAAIISLTVLEAAVEH